MPLRKRSSLHLPESVEFESEEEYREKLETLKESYFSRTPFQATQQTLSEGVDSTVEPAGGSMDAYLRTPEVFGKKS